MPTVSPIDLLERLHHTAATLRQMDVDILRLDKIHPLISGNKWLKLEGWHEAFLRGNYSGIISRGGPWSNHLHATGAFCHMHGIPFTAVVNSSPGFRTLTLCDLDAWKQEILYAPDNQFDHDEFWQKMAAEKNRLYIPMGGEGTAGNLGVTRFFDLLFPKKYDSVYCPLGTGTTLLGIMESKLPFTHMVAYNPGFRDPALEEKLMKAAEALPGKSLYIARTPGEKFGKADALLVDFMNAFYKQTGVPADLVYTGKMLRYFVKNLSSQNMAGSKVLIVHTGGLQGNRSLPAGSLVY